MYERTMRFFFFLRRLNIGTPFSRTEASANQRDPPISARKLTTVTKHARAPSDSDTIFQPFGRRWAKVYTALQTGTRLAPVPGSSNRPDMPRNAQEVQHTTRGTSPGSRCLEWSAVPPGRYEACLAIWTSQEPGPSRCFGWCAAPPER